MSLTRQIRKNRGEVVFARVGRSTLQVFEEMQLDADVDLFRTVAEALEFYRPPGRELDLAEDD